MLKSLTRTKPTVNEDDMVKLDKFTKDFGKSFIRYFPYFVMAVFHIGFSFSGQEGM